MRPILLPAQQTKSLSATYCELSHALSNPTRCFSFFLIQSCYCTALRSLQRSVFRMSVFVRLAALSPPRRTQVPRAEWASLLVFFHLLDVGTTRRVGVSYREEHHLLEPLNRTI
ncbi:hypothetical protein P171DRAFT_140041 [Karstenula rhodostoma CBS 690.94]|uniref:Uncharacterized protein n=1 Tax=Karstenula rhodostoma CBS 690.94 TaxID=1392251 RepID=A0A9P4PX61_9PLEO|nr:hypothetical protein P171DRAFT_140041 [Karstenula rhodostoma CBS 690.94]